MAEKEEQTTEEPEEEEAQEEEKEGTEEPEETEKAKPANELKVVIIQRDDKIMIGAQSPDCDPVYETLTGTLAAALKQIPKLVAGAKEKWAANPRNPNANLPKPEPRPAPARTAAKPKEKPDQPSFF